MKTITKTVQTQPQESTLNYDFMSNRISEIPDKATRITLYIELEKTRQLKRIADTLYSTAKWV